MKPHGERIATLEAEMIAVNNTLGEQGTTLADIAQKQQEILLALTKNRGMWGGIVLTMSAVGTVLTMAKDGIAEFIAGLFR